MAASMLVLLTAASLMAAAAGQAAPLRTLRRAMTPAVELRNLLQELGGKARASSTSCEAASPC
jgi:hypothetical protein